MSWNSTGKGITTILNGGFRSDVATTPYPIPMHVRKLSTKKGMMVPDALAASGVSHQFHTEQIQLACQSYKLGGSTLRRAQHRVRYMLSSLLEVSAFWGERDDHVTVIICGSNASDEFGSFHSLQ